MHLHICASHLELRSFYVRTVHNIFSTMSSEVLMAAQGIMLQNCLRQSQLKLPLQKARRVQAMVSKLFVNLILCHALVA